MSPTLLDVGHGRNINGNEMIEIPPSMVTFNEDELINKIYTDIENLTFLPLNIDHFLDRAILAPQNVDIQDTN